MRQALLLAAVALAVALSGCATAKMEVRARSHTQAPVVVQVWITTPTNLPGTAGPPCLPAGRRPWGRSTARPTTTTRWPRWPEACARGAPGSSYPSWTLEVYGDRLEDRLLIY